MSRKRVELIHGGETKRMKIKSTATDKAIHDAIAVDFGWPSITDFSLRDADGDIVLVNFDALEDNAKYTVFPIGQAGQSAPSQASLILQLRFVDAKCFCLFVVLLLR